MVAVTGPSISDMLVGESLYSIADISQFPAWDIFVSAVTRGYRSITNDCFIQQTDQTPKILSLLYGKEKQNPNI